ncbi:hypothetical protein [Marinobacterium mangrovicola]|nr:hypothetical protein [Marinobacterium mangrovicola]
MDNWIGIIGTLLGGVIGAGTTYFTANAHARRQMKWESVKLTQSKLEELAQVLDEFAHRYRDISGQALMQVQFGERIASDGQRIPHSRLAMLVHFYAPELRPDLELLMTLVEKYGEVLAEVIQSAELNTPQKQNLNVRLLTGATAIEKKCEEMSRKAAEVATAHIERLTAEKPLNRKCCLSAIITFAKDTFSHKHR